LPNSARWIFKLSGASSSSATGSSSLTGHLGSCGRLLFRTASRRASVQMSSQLRSMTTAYDAAAPCQRFAMAAISTRKERLGRGRTLYATRAVVRRRPVKAAIIREP
jgi:hypothetical protein